MKRRSAAVVVLLLLPIMSASATAELPEYTILRTGDAITVDGMLDEPAWQAAPTVGAFLFPWWEEGRKELTDARLLWDEDNLYVSFVAYDQHVSATLTQRDDPVSRDDAVEVFMAPDTAAVEVYFNFEFNALGTILDRSPRDGRSSAWNAEGLVVAITIDGTLNDESDEDRLWATEIAIPFSCFADYAAHTPPQDGDVWRLNLYRIGGQINPQFSVWSDTRTAQAQYHVPQRFGIVHFSTASATITAIEDTSLGQIKKDAR
jgi:cellulose/xylan binding protein with CBM9 domain